MIQTLGVIQLNQAVKGAYLMWLACPEIAAQSKPGQFFMVKCGDETTLRRPISLHLVDKEKQRIAFLYVVNGKGTEWLARRQKSEVVDIIGPLGNGFTLETTTKNVLLVAGGIGYAPLCYLADAAVRAGKKVDLLLGAATAHQLFPKKVIPSGVKVTLATEDGKLGHHGRVTELIPVYAAVTDQVFVCGPMPMLQYVAGHREELGLSGKNVQISMEMRMACGIGVCLGCTIRTKSGPKEVCKDGPVFNLDEVIWDELTLI